MSKQTFLVGTGVDRIYSCSLTSSGQLQLLHETKSGKGPTWLLPRNNLLYVANEHDDQIQTFTIDDRTQGTLTLVNTISSIGNTPCSLDIDASGKWLVVANYGHEGTSNFILFSLNDSNLPENKGAQINIIEGRGPHSLRQDHSHCHHALFHQNYMYVLDLGSDTLGVYDVNYTNGEVKLVGNQLKTEAGAGPRHILFHPRKPLAFVCNELNSTTDVYQVNATLGQLKLIQTIKTRRQEDENDQQKENYTAELQFTPDGNNLLVSNRGDENLVIFTLTADSKQVLNVKEHLDCHGSFTRHFTFDPTESFLLVANQKSNNLVCFAYNQAKSTYEFVSQLENIQSPQHIVFL